MGENAAVAESALFGRKTRPLTIPSRTRVARTKKGWQQESTFVHWILAASLFLSVLLPFWTGDREGGRPATQHRPSRDRCSLALRCAVYGMQSIGAAPLAPLTSLFASFLGCAKKDGPVAACATNEKKDESKVKENKAKIHRLKKPKTNRF